MRIAIFSDLFLEIPGGICSSIRAQRDGLVKAGHEVVIFCPGRHKHSSAEAGVVVVPTHMFIKPGGAPLSKRPKKVERFIEKLYPNFGQHFDLVHVHYEGSCSIAGMRLAKKYGLNLIQTMHGREDMAIEMNIPRPFQNFSASVLNYLHGKCLPHPLKVRLDTTTDDEITAATKTGDAGFDFGLAPTKARAKMWTLMVNHANFADVVITPSHHFARKLQHYGMTAKNIVISNAVADEMVGKFDTGWTEDKKPQAMLRQLEPDQPLCLFWNSRVSKEKRLLPILEAISQMKRPVKFFVCGDGNQLRRAKKLAKRLKIKSQVEFFGRVSHDDILEKMRNVHLSVMGSFGFDNQSMILLEAEATGLPVFFVDPDMAEVVPAGGAVNCVKELIKLGKWEPSRREAPTPTEIALILDSIKPEDIAKMSREMYAHRQEILQSTQLKKLIGLYKTSVAD